jgi:hypothetical protein
MLGTPYPPTVYIVFSLWLYPLTIFHLITGPENFPHYLTYWLKVLTTLVYFGSATVFYRIALEYSHSRESARYAAAVWLVMPLALFSEFIFSQYDIFYVLLTLAGFLAFLRRRLALASLCFGIAITFKYFPAFVFVPLLLFYEKRISRILTYCFIFISPTLLIDLMYGHSPAFVEGVLHHAAIDTIFAATIAGGFMGFSSVYTLPGSIALLCGISYFLEPSDSSHLRRAAYLWLVSSTLPFLLIMWNPQWVLFFAAPLVLTSILSRQCQKFLLLDIFGMFLFVGAVSLDFRDNVDAVMFQGSTFGVHFDNAYLMAQLFDWFGARSLNLFYSGFLAYLVIHILVKYRTVVRETHVMSAEEVNYDAVRRSLYIGLLMFILPASIVIYKDVSGHLHVVQNEEYIDFDDFGELSGNNAFEQTFVAEGRAIEHLSVALRTSANAIGTSFFVEIVDSNQRTIARTKETITASSRFINDDIGFRSVPVVNSAHYRIRLTSTGHPHVSGITWLTSSGKSYKKGQAIVNGIPKDADFLFRVVFAQ